MPSQHITEIILGFSGFSEKNKEITRSRTLAQIDDDVNTGRRGAELGTARVAGMGHQL